MEIILLFFEIINMFKINYYPLLIKLRFVIKWIAIPNW